MPLDPHVRGAGPKRSRYLLLSEIGKEFVLSHGYIENAFDVHGWAAPEFLDRAAKALLEEEWKKRTTAKLPETAAPLASGERLGSADVRKELDR